MRLDKKQLFNRLSIIEEHIPLEFTNIFNNKIMIIRLDNNMYEIFENGCLYEFLQNFDELKVFLEVNSNMLEEKGR